MKPTVFQCRFCDLEDGGARLSDELPTELFIPGAIRLVGKALRPGMAMYYELEEPGGETGP